METTSGLKEIQVSYKPTKEVHPPVRNAHSAYQLLCSLATTDTMELKEVAIVLYLDRAQQVLG